MLLGQEAGWLSAWLPRPLQLQGYEMDDFTAHAVREHHLQTALALALTSDRGLEWVMQDSMLDDPDLHTMAFNESVMRGMAKADYLLGKCPDDLSELE